MGHKLVKEHFKIGHNVHMEGGILHIGSNFISNILSFSPQGELVANPHGKHHGELKRYCDDITSNKQVFIELLKKADPNTYNIPVFWLSREDNSIMEGKCEVFGYPNTTHCGAIMYENTHYLTKKEATQNGIKEVQAGINIDCHNIARAEKELTTIRERVATSKENLKTLKALLAQHP